MKWVITSWTDGMIFSSNPDPIFFFFKYESRSNFFLNKSQDPDLNKTPRSEPLPFRLPVIIISTLFTIWSTISLYRLSQKERHL